MSVTFDRFRTEMEQKYQDNDRTSDNYDKDVIDLAEATKRMIKRKVDPMCAESQRKVMGLLKKCTSDMFNLNSKMDGMVDVNVTNIKGNHDEEALIVSLEMSSNGASANQSRLATHTQRAAKCQKGNKTQMTITAVLEQSSTGPNMNQPIKLTKGKAGSVSISDKWFQNESNQAKSDSNSDAIVEEEPTTNDSSMTKKQKGSTPSYSEMSKFIRYRCVHCQSINQWIESFAAVKDVYSHWLSWHTEPPNLKPFQYFVVEYVACFHCQCIGTYYELIKHHKQMHHSEPFAIVSQCDSKKCALCPYYGHGIVAHFDTQHRLVLKTQSMRQLRRADIPSRFTNTILEKSLEKRLHKKQKCGCCNSIFETERELREHHSKCHKMSKMTIKEFYDNNNTHLICNCCHVKVDRNLYLGHVENHAFNFMCCYCNFRTTDMMELVKHDKHAHDMMNTFEYRCIQFRNRLKRDYLKTRVIFGNGLVLTKQNLLTTKYDDSKQFEMFVDTLLKIKKERYNREMFRNAFGMDEKLAS